MDRARRVAPLLVVLVATLSLATLGANCRGKGPLAPLPGLSEFMAPAIFSVPGGRVVVAGGNLVVERADLSLDTRLGTHVVGATYNSADGAWRWSFEPTWDGTTFVDPSGARHALATLADGAAVPGTTWVRVDERTMKTKGGLVHRFAANGRLRHVRWSSSAYPRLEMAAASVAGAQRIVRIDQCTESSSCALAFEITRDGAGRVVRITDRAGRRAEFAYDGEGRLIQARDALAVTRGWPGFRYDYEEGRLIALESAEGERVAYRYTHARLTEVEALGEEHPVWRFSYHGKAAGLYRSVATDPTGVVSVFRYDGQRRVHELENGAGDVTRLAWSGRRVASRTLPSGETTTWTWHDDDPATRTDPSGNVVRFSWAPAAVNRQSPHARPLARLEDDLGLVEERSYDAKGRLVGVANGAGEAVAIAYDTSEMIAGVTSPNGLVTSFLEHGEDGHPRRIEGPLGSVPFEYDAVGNIVRGPSFPGESAPSLGGLAARSYDENRHLHQVTLLEMTSNDGSLHTLTLTYRSDGRRAYLARPYGGDAEFVYDAIGRLVERRDKASGTPFAAWQSTRFEYDAAGRRTAVERPNGMREEWIHDEAGRVHRHQIHRDGVLESAATFTWMEDRVTRIEDTARPGVEEFAFDAAGRVWAITHPDGGLQLFGYDVRSRPVATAYIDPSLGFQRTLGFAYDDAGREVMLRDGDDVVRERFYEEGRIASVRYGNGLERTWAYDEASGLVESTTTAAPGLPPVEVSTVGFTGSCPTVLFLCPELSTQTHGAVDATSHEQFILWDAMSEGHLEGLRLLRSSHGAPGAPQQRARTLYYDALSSTLERFENMGAKLCGQTGRGYRYLYNAEGNRLREIHVNGCATPAHTYAYDEAGFVVERDGVPIAWDGAGRIRSVGEEASFTWDTLGRPVSRTLLGVTTRLRFGGAVEASPSGIPTALDLGELRIDLTTGARLYRHHDFRHNVKFVTDDAGEVVVHYRYHGYGIDAVFGSEDDTHERFAQGRSLGELMLLGHRLYDPEAERFLAPDPIYQLVNQYTYTLGNPIFFWDPSGLKMTATGWMSGIAGSIATLAGVAALIGAGPAMPAAAAFAVGVSISAGFFGMGIFAAEAIDSVFGGESGSSGSAGPDAGSSLGSGGGGTSASRGQSALRGQGVGTVSDGIKVISGSYGIGPARWHGPPARTGAGRSGFGAAMGGGAMGLGGFGGGGGSGGGGGCQGPVGGSAALTLSDLLLLLAPWAVMVAARNRRAGRSTRALQ
jgi:RHS repeat-associated protein